MTASDEKIALVTLERQFGKAANWPKDKSRPVIAGTSRVLKQLSEDGYQAINPYEALSAKDRLEIAEKLAHVAVRLPQVYQQAGYTGVLSDLLACKAMREINAQLALERVLQAANLDPGLVTDEAVYRPLKRPIMPSDDKWASYSGKPDLMDRRFLFNDPYYLQLSTESGKKLESKTKTYKFSIEMGKPGKIPLFFTLRNKRLILKKFKDSSKLRYALFAAAGIGRKPAGNVDLSAVLDEIDLNGKSEEVSKRIARLVDQYHVEYETCRTTLTRWLAGQNRLPDAGLFNLFERPIHTGFGAALIEHDIAVQFRTHGGLVVHGSEQRKAITGLLSRTIYNEPESTTMLLPRSPLQIHYPHSQGKIQPTVNPFLLKPVRQEENADQRPFVILMAPNHIPWHWNIHGVTMCDFESAHTIRWLAGLLSGKDDMRLNIRIKSTVADKGKLDVGKHRLGMLPEDFHDLHDPSKGIFDVSDGSHQALLQEADLIVSEGVTAVFFEALEFRKPLLLLNRNVDREASLPAFDLSRGKLPEKRHAVYSATCEQDLIPALERISQLHKAKPLENHELEGLIWI